MRIWSIALPLMLSIGSVAAGPPAAPRGDATVTAPDGTGIADPYRALEDDSDATMAWVAAQAAHSEGYLARLPARATLRARLASLWQQRRRDVPVVIGDHWFFTEHDGIRNQPVLRIGRVDGNDSRVLLDPNPWSDDGTVALTDWRVSPDGRYLAYGRAEAGSDWNTYVIRDIGRGVDFPGRLTRVKFSDLAWAADSSGIFYSRYPDPPADDVAADAVDPLTHQALYFHQVGTAPDEDVRVYARPDHPRWGIGGQVSEDGRYLVINLWRGAAGENAITVQPLNDAETPWLDAEPIVLVDHFRGRYDFIGNLGPALYFITTEGAARGRLLRVRLDRRPYRFETLVAEAADTLDAAVFSGDRLVLRYLHDATHRLVSINRDGGDRRTLVLPAPGTVAALQGRQDHPRLYVSYTAFNQPPMVLTADTGALTSLWPDSLGFDPADYVTRQVFFRSRDGTRVPMFISHRRDLPRDRPHPTLLYGYGGFDISLTPRFSVSNLVWMEQGGVYAVANLRGGGEYGRAWHQAGIRARKQNVFDDFTAAAGYLIDRGWTRAEQLAIHGRSNGGLLVGAVLNQHPDLFAAAVPSVGVMDMLRFHRFTIGWAWTGDYGDPEDPADFAVLRRYSPYHRVRPGTRYPPVLITTADHDDRVVPAHSYKYAAALQHAQAGPAPILLRVQRQAGHGAGTPLSARIDEAADILAFLRHHTRAPARD